MKTSLRLIHIFAFLLATCLAYQKVAAKKKPWSPVSKFAKCQSRFDCSPKECCAGLSPTSNGTCLPQPQLKEPCNPFITPGAMECPCRIGMTCSTRITTEILGKRYGHCVYITTGPDEIDEDASLPRLP